MFPTQEEANDAAKALAKYLGTKVIDDSLSLIHISEPTRPY